jgi:hypothetical protein
LERGTCHTLWHRLDLDFVSNELVTGPLSAYTDDPCLSVDRRTDEIVMGPLGDLGPVDPQFPLGDRLVGAKDIVAAVDEAEERVTAHPETFALFSGLLSDVNMLMVEQARSGINRSSALVKEALGSQRNRTPEEIETLAANLQAPLIDDPASHSAVLPATFAASLGLPAISADPASQSWALIRSLWTRYFALGCFPAGSTAVYEGRRASQVHR